MTSTAAAMETGSVTFQLIDEDGEPLPGTWTYEWTGRDPLELAIDIVTEVSGKPWKWDRRRQARALLSPERCRALSIRVGKLLRKENRAATAAVIARVVSRQCLRAPSPDPQAIAEILAGKREADWEAGPHESTPAMLRALRKALRAAVECEGGLRITWGERED